MTSEPATLSLGTGTVNFSGDFWNSTSPNGVDPALLLCEDLNRVQQVAEEPPMRIPEWARQIMARPAGNGSARTVEDLIREYLSVTDSEQARKWLEDYALPAIGSLPLSELTPRRVEQLHASIDAPCVANRVVDALHAALRKGERWGIVDSNPARWRSDYKHPEKPRERVLSLRERGRLWQELARLEASDTPTRHGADWRMRSLAVQVLALTGLRCGEVIGLPWASVMLDADPPRIALTKTKAGKKECYLSPLAVKVLGRVDTPRDGLVFPWKSRKPVWTCWEHLRHECRFPDARIHDLRRTFWTVVGEAGVDPATAAAASGHGSVDVHVRHYRMVSAARRAEVMAVGGQAMMGGGS